MYRQILVPLDGSANAEQALGRAAQLARATAGALRLLHVHPPTAGAPGEGRPRLGRAAETLDAAARRIAAHTGLPVSTAVRSGPVVQGILAEAEDAGADVLVMTTHGHGGHADAWLGSIADGVARHATVPVLFVRPREAAAEAAPPGIRRVLVPLDGSTDSEAALTAALALAPGLGAALTLFTVDVLPVRIGDPPRELGSDDPAAQWATARAYLDEVATRVRGAGIDVDATLRASTSAAAAILEEVERSGCDIIAIATHGRTRLHRPLVGSVADKVLRAAHVPVLLIRPVDGTGKAHQDRTAMMRAGASAESP